MNNVTIRKISNGYIIVLPPTGGPAPSPQKEVFTPSLATLFEKLEEFFFEAPKPEVDAG